MVIAHVQVRHGSFLCAVADPEGGQGGHTSPPPACKNGYKKMAAKRKHNLHTNHPLKMCQNLACGLYS